MVPVLSVDDVIVPLLLPPFIVKFLELFSIVPSLTRLDVIEAVSVLVNVVSLLTVRLVCSIKPLLIKSSLTVVEPVPVIVLLFSPPAKVRRLEFVIVPSLLTYATIVPSVSLVSVYSLFMLNILCSIVPLFV